MRGEGESIPSSIAHYLKKGSPEERKGKTVRICIVDEGRRTLACVVLGSHSLIEERAHFNSP